MSEHCLITNMCLNCKTQLSHIGQRYCDECKILKDGGAWVDSFGKLIESDLQYECGLSAMLQDALMKIAEIEALITHPNGINRTAQIASDTLAALAVSSEQRQKQKFRIETERLRMRRGA